MKHINEYLSTKAKVVNITFPKTPIYKDIIFWLNDNGFVCLDDNMRIGSIGDQIGMFEKRKKNTNSYAYGYGSLSNDEGVIFISKIGKITETNPVFAITFYDDLKGYEYNKKHHVWDDGWIIYNRNNIKWKPFNEIREELINNFK